MRRLLCFLLVLLLFLPASASARDSISQNITVEVCSGGEWQSVPLHMLYAHERGMMADGFLVFVPLEKYLDRYCEDVPLLRLSDDFSYRVIATDYLETFSSSRELRQLTAGTLTVLPPSNTSWYDPTLPPPPDAPWDDLAPGLYLLTVNVTGKHGADSYSGKAFVWLLAE